MSASDDYPLGQCILILTRIFKVILLTLTSLFKVSGNTLICYFKVTVTTINCTKDHRQCIITMIMNIQDYFVNST